MLGGEGTCLSKEREARFHLGELGCPGEPLVTEFLCIWDPWTVSGEVFGVPRIPWGALGALFPLYLGPLQGAWGRIWRPEYPKSSLYVET